MMKLKHRKHMNLGLPDNSKIIIYYSAGEVFLGAILLVLAVFFAYNYYFLNESPSNCPATSQGPGNNS